MFAIPASFIGFAIGWLRAKKANGNTADKMQYGAAHALIFFLVAMCLTVLASWQGWV